MKEQKTLWNFLYENDVFEFAIWDCSRIEKAMKGYSDQQNAELREQLKETENSLDASTYNLKRVVKKCNTLTERVKELEGICEYALKAIKAVNSPFGATKPIIERIEKALKK